MKRGQGAGWVVTARDAFNGLELWRRGLSAWPTARFRSGPPQLPRLVVASAEHVYVPLELGGAVLQLDAASGKTLQTFDATKGAEEILLTREMLLVLRGEPGARHARAATRHNVLVAINPQSGKTRWTADLAGLAQPETLAIHGDSVLVQIGDSVVCLAKASGKKRWVYEGGNKPGTQKDKPARGKKPKGGRAGGYGRHVLVVSDGVVLCNLLEGLVAISVKDGEKLWSGPGGLGFKAPLDLFVIDGKVWTGHHPGDPAPPPFGDFNVVRDLHTGKIKSKNTTSVDLQTLGHHHRCYRNKATVNYILTGKRGIELFDVNGDKHSRNNWIRGTCQYGIMPANGLLYAPPHSCGCFPEVLVRGFYAMAARRTDSRRPTTKGRLAKGPAFGKAGEEKIAASPSAWPTFRGNVQRGAVVDTELSQTPAKSWEAKIGGRLSQPVVAAGTLLVSSLDQHTVYALDAKTGKARWSRTVGGRVDSPPTIHEGRLCLFGSADGYVYCLRLSDGELVWRFQAAPADQRTVVWGQIESVWPVHGSVLMLKDVAYVSAGRASFFDHGMELYGLNPDTGQVVYHQHYETPQPKFGAGRDAADAASLKKQYSRHGWTDYKTVYQSDKSRSFSSGAGSLSDILLSDGTDIFLRHKRFGSDLKKKDGPARHLYAISGLLNDMAGEARTGWGVGDGAAGFGATGGGRGIYKKTGFVRTVLAYDSEKVWPGVNLKTGKQLVKVAGSGLQLTPVDSRKKGATIALSAPVVWDGVAAADGRLYVSLKDGSVVCYE
jgi:outer membrane protein assembly factor BamB